MKKLIILLTTALCVLSILLFKHKSNAIEETKVGKKDPVKVVLNNDRLNETKNHDHQTRDNSTEEYSPEKTEPLTQAKLSELEGRIKNEFGIRDDILRFLENHIPPDNKDALKAAIKSAQYENQIYYHAKNQKEALLLDKKASLAQRCLLRSLPDDWLDIAKAIEKFMNDTPERKSHIFHTDQTIFAWQALGTGLTNGEEEKRCVAGKF